MNSSWWRSIMRMPNYKVSIMWWSIYHTISANNTSNSSKTRTKRKSYYKVYRSNSINAAAPYWAKPVEDFYPCWNCCNLFNSDIHSEIINHFIPSISAVCSLHVNDMIDSTQESFNQFVTIIQSIIRMKIQTPMLIVSRLKLELYINENGSWLRTRDEIEGRRLHFKSRIFIRLIIVKFTRRIPMPIE